MGACRFYYDMIAVLFITLRNLYETSHLPSKLANRLLISCDQNVFEEPKHREWKEMPLPHLNSRGMAQRSYNFSLSSP